MHRFYVAEEIGSDTVSICDEQFHHLKDVLRLKVNDEVTVFDGGGNECVCLIRALGKKQATLTVKNKRRAQTRRFKITVACAVPKKAGLDEIIDSLTQLGVDAIIPLETERVIVKLDDSKKEARLKRWRKIVQSAAQQSQRSSLPVVAPVTSIESVVARSQDFDLKLIPTLSGERKHISEVLAASRPGNILVLIGPEGDFTPQEIEMAKNAGFIPVSLGAPVLRVGTAATAIVGYIAFSLIS